jgi:hypothetical protein
MLISHEQWALMGLDRFAARVWAVLRDSQNYPDSQPRGFREFVQRSMTAAARYDLRDELSQARFAYAAWMLGETFHCRVAALNLVLTDRAMTSAEKSESLMNFMRILFGKLTQK